MIGSGRLYRIVVMTIFAAGILSGSCAMPDADPAPDAVIGNFTVTRSARDQQRYTLTFEVLNRSDDALQSLVFRARVMTRVGADENLETDLITPIEATIGSGVRITVTATVESPFTVVPPGPIVLDQIRVGEFVYLRGGSGGETYTVSGWIVYPWPVEESL